MKITKRALKQLVLEALDNTTVLRERPWSVEYTFQLSEGTASDSEGVGPDGFAVVMTGETGKLVRIIVDSYWNPSAGDESGNSLKVEIDAQKHSSTYVPTKFDDGKEQKLVISNAPGSGLIAVSHAATSVTPPVIYLVFQNPFRESEDVSFDIEKLGNGKLEAEMTGHTVL